MLQRLFDLKGHGTSVRTEILAGFTTFVTMAYIVVINPLILGDAGMPVAGVAVATCVAAGLGSILMGVLSNYPLALAPGMGLNAYFTYTVVKGMGLPWQTALGCVFISACALALLTAAGVVRALIALISVLTPGAAGRASSTGTNGAATGCAGMTVLSGTSSGTLNTSIATSPAIVPPTGTATNV